MSKRCKIAVIGAGVSGLTVANLLKDRGTVTLYEADDRPGGLIKCDRVEGSLFHTCGGHVFNTKRQDVLDFFWSFFDRASEFVKADRNSVVFMPDSKQIPYPIENHAYLLDDKDFIPFLKDMTAPKVEKEIDNFQDFLKDRFGETLYSLYFQPYNQKIWRRDLSKVPLTWLEGKLPMPTRDEIIYNNIRKVEEKKFVHSTFWYENYNGSQHIADRMASGLDIRYGLHISSIARNGNKWIVENEPYDLCIFCGNIKQLPQLIEVLPSSDKDWIEALEYHGTTSVFCEIDPNPYSWIYLPDSEINAHRIICTGNFATSNNAPGKMTATIEFTDYISETDIKKELKKTPLAIRYITHKFNKFTYPIQDSDTKGKIQSLKNKLADKNFFLTGRFADWGYYNMDAAMGAAIDLVKELRENGLLEE